MSAEPSVQFAHALLLSAGCYVLQHRDDKPGIAAPGMWALFGGRVETGELAPLAIVREIEEELCVRIENARLFWETVEVSTFAGALARYSFFEADMTRLWGTHRLMEGQAVARFTFEAARDLPMFPIMREVLRRHHAQHLTAPPQRLTR